MSHPRVLVLRAPGANCDAETAHAFQLAGAKPDVLHVNRWLESPPLARHYQILCIPGGFSYGDDLSAGRILANQLRRHLADALAEFRAAGKLVLGICNGFQVLVKSGLLDSDDGQSQGATLAWNQCGRFQDRWIHVETRGDQCVFLAGVERMFLPIAHAEGQFRGRDEAVLDHLEQNGQLVLRYADARVDRHGVPTSARRDGESAEKGGTRGLVPDDGSDVASSSHFNPNGAARDVAGMCDATGRVFGLMPHPERFIDRTQHPQWTRLPELAAGDGLPVFRNAVEYFQ